MDAESLARLQRNLSAATDDALVALANRGLLRRAIKDLESESLRVEQTDVAMLVHGKDWTVTMPPEGPASASDNTPATGVTRQILTATLYLRDHWMTESAPTATAPPSAEDSPTSPAVHPARQRVIDAPVSELMKWAGKTPLLEAAACFENVGAINIVDAPLLKIEFVAGGVSVVLMSDQPAQSLRKLLDQFKTTSDKAQQARWILLGVLAIKRAAGQSVAIDPDEGPALSIAVRADRQRIAMRTEKILSAFAASGIAHPSTRIVERLQTTSVAAEAARHPRLARLLRSIADDAELQIARSATADPARLMQRLIAAFALAEASARVENAERVDLFGRPRSTYTATGDLELFGVGAYGWRTASGYEGLTSLFWNAAGKQFLTATVARGEGQDRTFSLRNAYGCGVGWSGGASVEAMCRRQVKLTGAKVNVDGRISLAETCRSSLGDPTDPAGIDFADRAITRWPDLLRVAREAQPLGLRVPDPRAALVILQPTEWGPRWFDELEQAFVWQLLDVNGAAVEARIPWTEVDEPSVLFWEAVLVERDKPIAIVGRIVLHSGVLRIYPLTLFSSGTSKGDRVLCPQFDQARIRSRNEQLLTRLRAKYQRQQTVATRIGSNDDDEDESPADELAHLPALLRHLILDVDIILFTALETNASRLSDIAAQTLDQSREHFTALGLRPMAQALLQVLERKRPADLLRAAYCLQLLRQSASVCGQTLARVTS